MKKGWALFIVLSIILLSDCKDSSPNLNSPNQHSQGTIRIGFSEAPSAVAVIQATISRQDYQSQTIALSLTDSNRSAQGSFTDVVSGTWHLVVNALNSGSVVLYTGQTDVVVAASETSNVTLTLQPATGVIEITVNWGNGNGPLVYLPLNGNTADSSGNGNNGTSSNPMYATDRFGTTGAAYSSNGVDNDIVLPNTLNIVGGLTVAFWMQTTSVDSNSWPYGTFLVDRDICYLHHDWTVCMGLGGKIQFNTGTDDSDCTLNSVSSVNSGTWTFVVVVRDEGNNIKKIYVNGQLDNSQAFTGGDFTNTDVPVLIGAANCYTDTHTYYHGSLDDIRIYSRALSDSEITQLFQNNNRAGG